MNNLAKIASYTARTRNQEFLGITTQIVNSQRKSSDDVQFLSRTDPSSLKRGRGGRSSFSGVVATIFGASGFIGAYVVNRLGKTGTQMIIPYRADPYAISHLKVAGDLGQILFLPFHLCDEESIRKAVKYSNVVINLVGRDYETRNFSFSQVHVEGARRIARISKEMGVEKFIHMSALNSNYEYEGYWREGGSKFLKTKGESEDAVKEYFPDAIIFRPSDVWGQGDRFFTYFCRNFRYVNAMVALPQGGNGIYKMPVYVADLARGITNAVYSNSAAGNIYQAVGPRRYQLGDLIDWFNQVMKKSGSWHFDENMDKELPDWGYKRFDMKWDVVTKLKAIMNEYNPSNPVINLIPDKIEREAVSDTLEDLPNLEDLGVSLTKMEDRIEWELEFFRSRGYFHENLREFDKPIPPKYTVVQ